MKDFFILVAIIAIGWGAFTFIKKPEASEAPSPLSQWMQNYEAVISKYEQKGISTDEDRVGLASELAALVSALPNIPVTPSEAEQLKAKTAELGNRQAQLISTTEVETGD